MVFRRNPRAGCGDFSTSNYPTLLQVSRAPLHARTPSAFRVPRRLFASLLEVSFSTSGVSLEDTCFSTRWKSASEAFRPFPRSNAIQRGSRPGLPGLVSGSFCGESSWPPLRFQRGERWMSLRASRRDLLQNAGSVLCEKMLHALWCV